MKNLSFPVKLLLALPLAGCGYEPLYGGDAPRERLAVVAGRGRVPNADVIEAALDGARVELTRAGSLAPGSGHPRLVVEVLRIDEQSAGVIAEGETPIARGAGLGVVGRGWVEEAPRGAPVRDTGDVRRVVEAASGADAPSDEAARSAALRAAASDLGHALARSVLGEPEPASGAP